jgi:hypothetical protein
MMSRCNAFKSISVARPEYPGMMRAPQDRLSNVHIDLDSGLHIGTIEIGDQTLRVGIRPPPHGPREGATESVPTWNWQAC